MSSRNFLNVSHFINQKLINLKQVTCVANAAIEFLVTPPKRFKLCIRSNSNIVWVPLFHYYCFQKKKVIISIKLLSVDFDLFLKIEEQNALKRMARNSFFFFNEIAGLKQLDI